MIDLSQYKIVLGSGSPRRRELIEHLKVPYSIRVSDVDEIIPVGMNPQDVPVYLSELKSNHLAKAMGDDELIITADTIVIVDDEILGKPVDREDGYGMIKKMSGRTHQVVTGITIRTADEKISASDLSEVTFLSVSDEEIYWYIDNFNPMDKAGAYGIQDWIGSCKISNISGSYYNIMGLPMHKLYVMLEGLK
jgi:septum formation protein